MADQANEYYAHALDLLSTFSTKHGEIDANRNVVRQRTIPDEQLKGKRLITVRQARGFALVFQLRSFFDRAASKIKVRPETSSKKDVGYTTEQERWLGGVSHVVAAKSGFVYSNAIWHGLESGEMQLGLSFNPLLARQGTFGIRPRAIDPRSSAYEWTENGLGCFVTDETQRVGEAYKELFGEYEKSGKRGYDIPREFQLAYEHSPTQTCKLMRYYTSEHECLWIDDKHVWSRKHHMGRVPFDVGYLYDMPADWSHPEERGRGAISPIRDLLQEEETLYDIYASNAEFGQRPMVLYWHATKAKWMIGVSAPNAVFDAPMQTPPTAWTGDPNYQLLETLQERLNQQIEINSLPNSALRGEQGNASGYALSLYNEPIRARFDSLRRYPELTLASHYELMLLAYKKFALVSMARELAPKNVQAYMDSFSVSVDIETKPGKKKLHSWVSINPDDISIHPFVEVSLKPDLPTDKGAQMQQFDLAMRSGKIPARWAYEHILDVDDPDEVERQMKFDWLFQNNEGFKAFISDYWMKEVIEDTPDLKKEMIEWEAAQEAEAQEALESQQAVGQGVPPPEQGGGMAMSPAQFEQMLMQGQGGGMGGANPFGSQPVPGQPVGTGLPSAATLGIPGGSEQLAQGLMPQQNFMPPQGA